jgi:ribosomal protein S18 acetylase RimI-like enzyme
MPTQTPVQLLPAASFSIEQLTAAYNQTRVDYLVPMPMNVARLAEYIHTYDVDMDRSLVAVDGDQILGLAMLGVRPGRAWVTRLGVLPVKRKRGVGEALMRGLLAAAEQLGVDDLVLEVIKNNTPAHALFLKLGFRETGELLVLRRPPAPPASVPPARVLWLDRCAALASLRAHGRSPAWTNETESFAHAEGVLGIFLTLPDGSRGWLVFQRHRLILQRLTLMTERGDPYTVGHALLMYLYREYPDLDTHAENIPVNDPHVKVLFEIGCVESFRRIEMKRLRSSWAGHLRPVELCGAETGCPMTADSERETVSG